MRPVCGQDFISNPVNHLEDREWVWMRYGTAYHAPGIGISDSLVVPSKIHLDLEDFFWDLILDSFFFLRLKKDEKWRGKNLENHSQSSDPLVDDFSPK